MHARSPLGSSSRAWSHINTHTRTRAVGPPKKSIDATHTVAPQPTSTSPTPATRLSSLSIHSAHPTHCRACTSSAYRVCPQTATCVQLMCADRGVMNRCSPRVLLKRVEVNEGCEVGELIMRLLIRVRGPGAIGCSGAMARAISNQTAAAVAAAAAAMMDLHSWTVQRPLTYLTARANDGEEMSRQGVLSCSIRGITSVAAHVSRNTIPLAVPFSHDSRLADPCSSASGGYVHSRPATFTSSCIQVCAMLSISVEPSCRPQSMVPIVACGMSPVHFDVCQNALPQAL
nr:hypothetical protein CFP56_52516 [Quercus suber]